MLEGRRVLITGGGTGVGRGVALMLAAAGSRVAIAGRREDKLAETASLHSGEGEILYRACDVASRSDVEALVAWADEALGGIDALVNSAGMNIVKRTMQDIDPDEWDKVLAVNASGAFYCMKGVLPQMRERQDGVIVNISSVAGKRAVPLGGVSYNASKFAMTALGTSVALEEKDRGIRVTNIYPGELNTPILDARPVPVSDEHKAQILQPEDVAEAVKPVLTLPARAHIPDLVIKPTTQAYA